MDSIAVTNPCIQNEWEEWKRGMEDNRRRWRERVSHWIEEVNEENDRQEEDMHSEEDEGIEENCEKGAGEHVEEWEEEMEMEEEEIKGIMENKHGDELVTETADGLEVVQLDWKADNNKDEGKLVSEAEIVGVEEEDNENIKWELERNGETPQGKDVTVVRAKEEGQNEFWMEGKVNEEGDEVAGKEVLDTKEMQVGQEDQHEVEVEIKEENEANKMGKHDSDQDEKEEKENIRWELKMNEEEPYPDHLEEKVEGEEVLDTKELHVGQEDQHEVEVEIKEEDEVNKMGKHDSEQGEKEEEENIRWELKMNEEEPHPGHVEEEVEGEEVLDTKELHVGQEDQHEVEMENKVWDEEEDDGDEEHQETEDYVDDITKSETDIIKGNLQSNSQEDLQICKDSNSVDNEDSGSQIKDGQQSVESQMNQQLCSNPIVEAWTFLERQEGKDSGEMTAESKKTQEEEFQDDPTNVQEESTDDIEYIESTDDEEAAEQSNDEDEDSDDEDMVKNYSKDDYPTDIFQTLTQFKDSSLLTDLTLRTKDEKSFHVHSPVLAAVSSFIWGHLSRMTDDTHVGVQGWSVSLGPEVDRVGLEAVVEFAYTGMISCLNVDTAEQIRTAAQSLGMPRVLRLCTDENSVKPGGQKNFAEQRMISLQAIKQLWMDGVGCDVILEALGDSIHAHRIILAASSDYFRGMFASGMRESYESSVALPFLMAPDLEVLVSCSYSGALPLSWKCIFEITSTTLQLQYQPALSLCLKFLQQEMNPYYCLDVASFAEAYEIVQLLEVADDFVLRQFQKVAQTVKFKDLPAKQLFRYLSSHSLCVPSELVVFQAVMTWIQAKPKRRLKLAKELMKMIHFPLMTFKEFKEVQSLNIWADHSLAELYEAVFQDFCSSDTMTQTHCRIYLPKQSLVLTGGDQISEDLGSRSISRELWFGNSLRNHTGIRKAMEWRRLGEMPEPARFSHEVAVLKGQLYVFGGKKYYGISDTLNSVCRYDPLQNHWENLAQMQQSRCSFSVVVLDDKIYALGGHCDPDYIDSVEQYCPTANCWSYTWPLDLPLSGHVAKVLQGKIFVSGGRNSDYQCLSSMFVYQPEAGCTYLANMIKPRAHHCMETLGQCLYVAGGITTDDNTSVVDQLTCEVYSPAADSWAVFASLPVPHVGAGSSVLEGKFYVLGGYSQEDYTDTKMVHRYDPTLQRWENMGKMPGPNNDIRASLLCLPPHLRL